MLGPQHQRRKKMKAPETFPEYTKYKSIEWIITQERYTNRKAVMTQNDLLTHIVI